MKKQSEMNGTDFLNAQKNSQFKDMVRRLFKNKAAVAGLIFLIFLILMAVFADVLFDYDTQCINRTSRSVCSGRRPSIGSAPTSTGAIC